MIRADVGTRRSSPTGPNDLPAGCRREGALGERRRAPRTSGLNLDHTPAEPAGSYAATVRDASYRITDTDIEGMTSAGYSEDAIFEITVVAVGAAIHRLDAGRHAIHSNA